jgi:isoleucyl-tRNA synthetase
MKFLHYILLTILNDELIKEGIAREIVNKINTMRRNLDFAVTDRINITLQTTPAVMECFASYQDYIANEVLANHIIFGECPDGAGWDINGEQTIIKIEVSN